MVLKPRIQIEFILRKHIYNILQRTLKANARNSFKYHWSKTHLYCLMAHNEGVGIFERVSAY